MTTITIENHGPLIVATNYWESDTERAGKLFCSTNAGAVRVLLPRSAFGLVGECRTAECVILSRGPWPAAGKDEAVELLFDDGSDAPFALHLSAESFDLLPAEPEPGHEWIVSLWTLKKDKPHKALERACKWRRCEKLPDLSPWNE